MAKKIVFYSVLAVMVSPGVAVLVYGMLQNVRS